MRHPSGVVIGAVGLALLLAGACQRKVIEERDQVAHRVKPCEVWCNGFHGECGKSELWDELVHRSAEECTAICADPEDPGFNWSRDEDGEDVCKEEWFALAECLPTLSCEEQDEFWNASRVSEYPCKEQNKALASCYSDWAWEESQK